MKNQKMIVGKFRLSDSEENFIRNKVASLPNKERLAIYFLFWEQRTLSRIASELDVGVSDVSCLINNAMTKLRSELNQVADNYFGKIIVKHPMDQAA